MSIFQTISAQLASSEASFLAIACDCEIMQVDASWCCNPNRIARRPKLQTSFIAPATRKRDRTWAKSMFTKFPCLADICMATAMLFWPFLSFHPKERTWRTADLSSLVSTPILRISLNWNIHRKPSNKCCFWMQVKRKGKKAKCPVPATTVPGLCDASRQMLKCLEIGSLQLWFWDRWIGAGSLTYWCTLHYMLISSGVWRFAFSLFHFHLLICMTHLPFFRPFSPQGFKL